MCTKFQNKTGLDDEEVENAAENEYCFLLRQNRIMENDKAAFSNEIECLIRKQRTLMSTLRGEKRELMTKVIVATCPAYENENDHINEALMDALQTGDKNDEEIIKLNTYLREVEVEIRKEEKKAKKLRLQDITDYLCEQKAIKSMRTVRNLENQLYVANCRFNKVVAENRNLREVIDHTLCERIRFNENFYNLIGKLNEGKKVLLDLIELATLAYDQREEALTTLNSLQDKAASHLAMESHEMSILERKMDDDLKLKEFLEFKGQRRVMADVEAKRAFARECKREEMESMITMYEEYLEHIREFNQETDIDTIAKYFLKNEEENFSMFLYVIHLNDEVERLEKEVEEFHEQIQRNHALRLSRCGIQKEKLHQMAQQLADKNNAIADSRTTLQRRQELLEKLLDGIDQLFVEVKGDRRPIQNLLGDNTHVTRHNNVMHLQMTEHNINLLMNKVYYLEKRTTTSHLPAKVKLMKEERRPRFKPAPMDILAPTQPCALCVEQEELSKLEEDEVRPLTRGDLEHKLEHEKTIPDFFNRLHNLSACRLPRSRKILQRRYM